MFNVKVQQQSGTPTLVLTGRLDSATAPKLEQALDGVLAKGPPARLVFDLGALDYLSSAGIRCFIRARKAVEPKGGSVAVVNPQPAVRKVLDIVQAVPAAGIFASVAELDDYLDEMQRRVREGDSR